MAARLAILKAARQLAVEADVHVVLRKFAVINQVGAVSIDAKLDCEAFASTHSATSHYDRASFVGLAWRPGGEPICCGALISRHSNLYRSSHACCVLAQRFTGRVWKLGSNLKHALNVFLKRPALRTHRTGPFHQTAWVYLVTGRANLPGSTRQRDLLVAFSRMMSELLRHSSKPEVRALLKAHLQQCHRPRQVQRDDAPVQAASHSAAATRTRAVDHESAPAPGPLHDLFGEEDGWLMPALSAVPLPGAAGAPSGSRAPSADADDELLANAGYFLG